MKALQVPTHPIAVEIFTSDGEHSHGLLYLGQPQFDMSPDAEVLVTLNDERGFLPFASGQPEDSQRLLNKDHIVRVRIGSDQSPEALPCGTLLLSDGSRLTGTVMVDTPPSASRLVDKLNQAPRFLPVVHEDGIDFVQRTHITRVYARLPWPSSTN